MDSLLPTLTMATGQLLARKRTAIRFAPGAADRAAIAQALDLIDLPDLLLEGEIVPENRGDLRLQARLTGRAVQACIVTLAPVPAKIDAAVLRQYQADWQAPEAEETEIPEDDTIEPLPHQIDIAAVAIEALALALPEYPRAAGAELGAQEFPAPDAAPEEAPAKPLAGLAALLAQKSPKPDGGV